MIVRKIRSDPAHKALVLAGREKRHRVAAGFRLIKHDESRHRRQQLLRLVHLDPPLRLDVDGDGMSGKDGDAYRRRRDADRFVSQDLPGLEDQFQFFFCVAVRLKDVDVRNDVERNLLGKALISIGLPEAHARVCRLSSSIPFAPAPDTA